MTLITNQDGKNRCFGNKVGEELYAQYHDLEWGIPKYKDHELFEMLLLEGAQAGLSWYTILKKRSGYQRAFKNFDPEKVAIMTESELEQLMQDSSIVRNRLKIYSARKNAIAFLNIQQEFGSFSKYLWAFVDNKIIVNHYETFKEVPTATAISDQISKDLKKRGMTFVGTTIIYAYMQSVGLVNDHLINCHLRN